MSDEAVAEKSDVPRQKLWPIFLFAFALAAFGFYMVFGTERSVADGAAVRAEAAVAGEALVLDGGTEQTADLEYSRSVRTYLVTMTHRARRDEKELVTTLQFRLRDEPSEPQGDELLAFKRTFHDARVTVETEQRTFGVDVTNEVVRLLEAAVLEAGYARGGQLVRREVVSSESAQLRPTLDLIGDGLRFLYLPLPEEAVNRDESWSIAIPSEVVGDDVIGVEGSIDISSELAELTAERALLKVAVSGATRSTWDDGEERRGHVEVVHSGGGEMLWDREKGEPGEARYVLQRSTREPDGTVLEEAEIVLRFRAKP